MSLKTCDGSQSVAWEPLRFSKAYSGGWWGQIYFYNNSKIKLAISLSLFQLYTGVSHYLEDLHNSANTVLSIWIMHGVTKSCICKRSIWRPKYFFVLFCCGEKHNVKFTTLTVFKCTAHLCYVYSHCCGTDV